MIRLWDNEIDNILCSRYDPISIGNGEVGVSNEVQDDNSTVLAVSPTSRKRKAAILDNGEDLSQMITSITQLCKDARNETSCASTSNIGDTNIDKNKPIGEMTLEELYQGVEAIKRQIDFLSKMGALPDELKNDLVEETKDIFVEIRKRFKSNVS